MQSIIFVHTGNSFYLHLAIKQAKKTNPNIDIILLGDDSNKSVTREGVLHFYVSDYFHRAEELDHYFINNSPNARHYELFCFQRWLIIWEFIKKNPQYDDKFVYCDTDTLLFADVTKDLEQLGNHPLALEEEVGPAFTFFNKGTLDEFCNTIEWFYKEEEGKRYVCNFIEEKRKANAIHGFSDMYAFEYYVRNVRRGEVIDAMKNYRGGWGEVQEGNTQPLSRYDQNVNFKEDFTLTPEGIKKFEFIDGKPYCYSVVLKENILFKGIHFQGKAKYEMLKFCNEPMPFLSENWFQYYIIYNLKKIKRKIKIWKRHL